MVEWVWWRSGGVVAKGKGCVKESAMLARNGMSIRKVYIRDG